jgi:hypothetical protein
MLAMTVHNGQDCLWRSLGSPAPAKQLDAIVSRKRKFLHVRTSLL